jgi:hypothetical protein
MNFKREFTIYHINTMPKTCRSSGTLLHFSNPTIHFQIVKSGELATSTHRIYLSGPNDCRQKSSIKQKRTNAKTLRQWAWTRKMNFFRLTGDLAHLLAIVILLLKVWKTRSCAGGWLFTAHQLLVCPYDLKLHSLWVWKPWWALLGTNRDYLRRYLRSVATAICACVHLPLLGSVHQLCVRLQLGNEGVLPCLQLWHSLSNVHQIQSHIRSVCYFLNNF